MTDGLQKTQLDNALKALLFKDITELKEEIQYFVGLMNREIFGELKSSSSLTLEIIKGLENILKNKIDEYNAKYPKKIN